MPKSSQSLRTAIALAVSLGVATLAPRDVGAYCRTSTCPGNVTGTLCTPSGSQDCGIPLYWASPCVSFSMQQNASKQVPLDTATQVFTAAFSAWTNAECLSGGQPRISLTNLGPVECDSHEYNQTSGNANIIMFRDDGWPHEGQGDTLALTTVTFNLQTGEIYDADIEVNSTQGHFTTTDTNVVDDLQSVATHEAGHFLGLAHTPISTATMFAEYTQGSTDFRTLEADDIAAICAVYPPGAAIPSTCDPTPRHGFSSTCGADTPATTKGCCAVAPGSAPESPDGTLALGALALSMVLRRTGRRRR